MKIKKRIHARKLVLAYLYRHGFLFRLDKNDPYLEEVAAVSRGVEHVEQTPATVFAAIEAFVQQVKNEDPKDKALYLTENCFDNRGRENIDMEYVFAILSHYPECYAAVQNYVNTYTTSFRFEQMDMIDQSVFILGYLEYITIQTPKEILLNELVELTKRYSDGGSRKLINGIMHKIIEELDSQTESKEDQ